MLRRVGTSNRAQPSLTGFGITQRELDRCSSLISVEGELDLSTAPRLKWMLVDSLRAGHSQLIVDLSLATFMDSTTLGVLLGVERSLDTGARLAIICPRAELLKIFELSGMDQTFAVFPTLGEALAHAGGTPLGPADGANPLMASDTNAHPPPTCSLWRLAVASALGCCCAFALSCIPAAARPNHARPTPTPTEGKTGAPPKGVMPSQAPHPQRDRAGDEQPQQEPGRGEQQAQEDREQRQQDPGRHDQQQQQQQDQGHHEQQQSPQDPGHNERRQQESDRGEQQDRGRRRQGASSGAAPGASTAVLAAPAGVPAPLPPTVTASTATISPQPTVTASVSMSPPQVAGTSRQAVTGRSHHAARRFRHVHGRVPSRSRPQAALSPRGVALVAAAPAITPVSIARTGGARATTHGPPRHGPSRLITTITKIVGVIPTQVWMLIGALLALAAALAARSRLAALRARRLERQRGQLLEDVGLLQAALLPVVHARLGPVGTSAAYRPADGPGAGGDFYDVFALGDGQLAVIVGDISGHGRQALPHTALVRFTLRAYLEAGLSPRGAVQTAGAVLERQLGESFATVVVATYQPRDRVLVYACAGHPPPVVLGLRSIAPVTICSSPPIGAGMRTGTRQTVVSITGRSQICFHTDGVTEARIESELFGAERVARALAELGPQATAAALLDRVAEETDTRPDDMAACLLRVEGAVGAPTVLAEELELDREQATSERTERFLLACGVERDQVAELVCAAHVAAGRTGTVLLRVSFADGPPEVTLQSDNVALLHTPQALRRERLRASL
jgi:anti-anti-sigma factor